MEFTDYVTKVAAQGQFENNASSVFLALCQFENLRLWSNEGP